MNRNKQNFDTKKRKGSNYHIINNLMIVFFIIITVFLFTFYRSFFTFSKTMKDSIERNIIDRADENSLDVRSSIKGLFNQIEGISSKTEIRSMKWEEQEPVLLLECQRSRVESMQIAKLDGSAKSSLGYTENIKEQEYFQKAIQQLTSLTDPIVREYDGKTVILCSAPIFDARDRVAGVLVTHMEPRLLFEPIENMSLGNTGFCCIVNREGELVGHSPMDLGELSIIDSVNNRFNDNKDFNFLLDSIKRGETGNGYFTTDKTQRFIVYTPVEDTQWSLVLSLDRNGMFFEVDSVAHQFQGVLAILLVLTILFAIYCIRSYTQNKKIHQLKLDSEKNTQLLLESKEIDKLRTEFFANISHELRTPLNVILSSIQLINLLLKNKPYIEKESAQKHLDVLRRNSLRLNRLINNLIDTTRINSKFYELNTSKCDIVQIIHEIVVTVEDYVKRKGITLSFYTDVQEKTIICDVDKVERIMLNLLSNAIKFTDKNGRVSIFLNDGDTYITVAVEDTGVGIPQEKIEMIFARFHQVDRAFSRNFEGSGIGLSLVKSMVEIHGGTISVNSTPGKGSKFVVTLPVNQDSYAPTEDEYQYDRNQFNQRIQTELADFITLSGSED
ncbi:MAG: sensor histidine kinase [Ruminiclostridium sp.]|nr:sensor histidine kinase [Ruminiclostridium sp.]